jgi:cellulose synthase/poly-beta-1,6-N-acetylglucosamine synthase-like glycosyltransferase
MATLTERDADAVAFYLDVDNRCTLLGQLQRQEYVAALNFERAGQDEIGAISILPGAATLYRRDLLMAHPFSPRTRTEDADLTLHLARQGMRIALAADAVASTVVPGTWGGLVAQRVRWMAGHLQCCTMHALERGNTRWFFRTVVFPNFMLSTLMVAAGFTALVAIVIAGGTSLLGLGWLDVVGLSIVLAYAQRGCIWILDCKRRARLWFFLLEPFVMSLLSIFCFLGALFSLLRATVLIGRRKRA